VTGRGKVVASSKTGAQWQREVSGDIPHLARTVQRNGTTYTLHLHISLRQAPPHPSRAALIIAEVLVIQGLTRAAGGGVGDGGAAGVKDDA